MCGLVGFVDTTKDISSYRNVLNNMNEAISKRGPDEDGIFISTNVCFAHKRLIVIDPKGGKQPMVYKQNSNTYAITYNGQIYNTPELKEELKTFGYEFESHSDTEVLLKAYCCFGHEIVNKLNGIFAFAIWDENKKELFIARDHFGIKPLYYSIVDSTLVFASEVKALFKYPGITAKIDSEGICELFGLGPCHTAVNGSCKISCELKPAQYAVYNWAGVHVNK